MDRWLSHQMYGEMIHQVVYRSIPDTLSFSTVPKPNSWRTTLGRINSTGIVSAVPDGLNHVSVYSVGGTIGDWRRQGVASVWTQTLMSVCEKYKY